MSEEDMEYDPNSCLNAASTEREEQRKEQELRDLQTRSFNLRRELKIVRDDLEFIAQGGNTATSIDALCRCYEFRARDICNKIDKILEQK